MPDPRSSATGRTNHPRTQANGPWRGSLEAVSGPADRRPAAAALDHLRAAAEDLAAAGAVEDLPPAVAAAVLAARDEVLELRGVLGWLAEGLAVLNTEGPAGGPVPSEGGNMGTATP